MKYRLREAVLKALNGSDEGAAVLSQSQIEEWRRNAFWLDASGLALYLLESLRSQDAQQVLPEEVLKRLLQNEADNGRRTKSLLAEFARVNEALEHVGVPFAALKGFALFPEYCPDPCRRLQLDLDYLVDRRRKVEITKAVTVLGYEMVSELPFEVRFATNPNAKRVHADLYKPPASHVMEFHFSLFDRPELSVNCPPRLDLIRKTGLLGVIAPVLSPADMFLHQIFHAFQDVCLFSLRLSCLLEISNAVRCRLADEEFWAQVQQRADACDERAAGMVALVLALARKAFNCPIPENLIDWIASRNQKQRAISLWVERYGNDWVLDAFPGNKASLLIAREFMLSRDRARYTWKNLLPMLGRESRRHSTIKKAHSDRSYRLMRWWFHIREALRVMVEWPRWKWISWRASSV